jgi:hypothetical protein
MKLRDDAVKAEVSRQPNGPVRLDLERPVTVLHQVSLALHDPHAQAAGSAGMAVPI